MAAPSEPEKHFGTKDFVELIRGNISRLLLWGGFRDRAAGLAPEPVSRYGNRDLFLESQAAPYVQKLLNRGRLERRAAQPSQAA